MSEDATLPLVMAISGDPGGANALAPVIKTLRASGRVRVEARAYRQAGEVWRRCGVLFADLDEEAEPSFPQAMQLLLTSTSINGVDLEKRYTAAARMQGVASLGLLDFWSNYGRRFSSGGGVLEGLPDRIAIMDAQAQQEMIAEGFEAERLVITGQPAFDDLARCRVNFTPERRREVRRQLGVNDSELLVVFASQPLSVLCATDGSLLESPGYDEHLVVRLLVSALEQIAAERDCRLTLLIRPHPREDAASFDYLRSDRVRIRVTAEGDGREIIFAADLVTGMSSVLLVEACYLGCLVVSIQPNLRQVDILPTNRLGFSRAVYTGEETLPALRTLLFDEDARRNAKTKLAEFRTTGDAARRVADLVFFLMQRHPISTPS